MPLACPAALPPTAIVREERNLGWSGDVRWNTQRLYQDATRIEFDRFRVGEMKYLAARSLHASYEPPMQGSQGRFLVAELSPEIVGRGNTLKLARRDWELNLDLEVQRLLSLQDFELTDVDKQISRKIHRVFDMNQLRYAIPLQLRAYGRVVRVRGHRFQVRWIDGQMNWLTANRVPANMRLFKAGQAFEAVVRRDPRKWDLLKVESAFPAVALPEARQEEADVLFSASKSDLDVEELDWD